MTKKPSILVVDDDPGVVAWLVEALGDEGFAVHGETSARVAIELLGKRAFDLVVSDVEMPEMRGLDLLQSVQMARPSQLVLLITAFGSIDLAVEAVRGGAVDFLAKPFRIEVLVLAIRRALRERQMRREIVRLREAGARQLPSGLIARSPRMLRALEVAGRVAKSDLAVLLTGESGVGKGAVARFVHEASGRSGPLVHVNCAALPAGIAEAELFGVRRGAFTDARDDRAGLFEQANQGTLFLDELGELPLEMQPKLLRVLESNQLRPLGGSKDIAIDVRIVTATNRSLEEAVRGRLFREDLFHRINVVRIEIPPLRERSEDIVPLVDHAMARILERSGRAPLGISQEAIRWLRVQPWPGNVRELMNAVERAVALTENDALTLEDFSALSQQSESFLDTSVAEGLSLAALERAYIRRVLATTGGHKGKAAEILGLDRRTLYRKVAEMDARMLAPQPEDEEPEDEESE